MNALIDSDVLIDYLQGIDKAKKEFDRYDRLQISAISWIEIMAGAASDEEEQSCRTFLSRFELVELGPEVAIETVRLRKKYKLRLPDTIIWASARVRNSILVTRNTKGFPSNEPGVRFPYSV